MRKIGISHFSILPHGDQVCIGVVAIILSDHAGSYYEVVHYEECISLRVHFFNFVYTEAILHILYHLRSQNGDGRNEVFEEPPGPPQH